MAPHCDSMDGPVVGAARDALGPGMSLSWCLPERDGADVRAAFPLSFRCVPWAARLEPLLINGSSRPRWVFTELVRAPYTGLNRPAVLGLLVLIPYWIAAHNSGEIAPWRNVLVHALGAVGVLVLLIVPSLRSWVNGHVMAGK